MPQIPSDTITDILDRVDIVDVVGEYVSLRKTGSNYLGLCPFHTEKTPSFNVSPNRGIFHCFGCQIGGDAIKFLREIEGLSFVETAKKLAARVGIEIVETNTFTPSSKLKKDHLQSLYEINKIALSFYEKTLQLNTSSSEKARQYLQQRNISKETWEKHRLGYAPASWNGLLHHLEKRKVSLSLAVELGLLVAKGGDRHYDRFRDRVLFPVLSAGGEILGFSGRSLEENAKEAKYLNSPESVLFKKGEGFLGLFFAKNAIRKAKTAILVEGNFDYLRLHEKGITEAVAPMGTALTNAQTRKLKRFSAETVILFYDGDSAGKKAQKRALPLFLSQGIFSKIAPLEKGEDPDTFADKHSAKTLREFLTKAKDGLEYWMEEAVQNTQGDIPARARAAEEIAKAIQQIPNDITQELYRKKLAERLWVSQEVLKQSKQARPKTFKKISQGETLPQSELSLAKRLLINPRLRSFAQKFHAAHYVSHPGLQKVISLLETMPVEEPGEKILASIPSDGIKQALREVLIQPAGFEEVGAKAEHLIAGTIKYLRDQKLERKIAQCDTAIKAAKASGDEEKAAKLLDDLMGLKREKEQILHGGVGKTNTW